MEDLTRFLGWTTLAHFALLAVIALAMLILRKWMISVHGRMFDMDEATLNQQYFQYLAFYKILVIVFFLVPYLVLRLAM